MEKRKFFKLQPEARELIYNKLPQWEVIQLRLVSKRMREEIDTKYNFNLYLDDRKPPEKVEFLLSRRIVNLRIIHFMKDTTLVPIFKYPEHVRTLTLGFNSVTLANFHLLMNECAEHLVKLSIALETLIEVQNPSDIILTQYNYKNLKHLELFSSFEGEYKEDCDSALETSLFSKFLQNHFQPPQCKLHTIEIHLSDQTYPVWAVGKKINDKEVDKALAPFSNKLSVKIISFFVLHWETLKVLRIMWKKRDSEMTDLDPFDFEDFESVEDFLGKMDTLKELSFNLIGCRNNAIAKVLRGLMKVQKKLETLKVDISKAEQATISEIESAIIQNKESLENISLSIRTQRIGNNIVVPLELPVFKKCPNLKCLKLTRRDGWNGKSKEAANLRALSKIIPNLCVRLMGGFKLEPRM